MTITWIEVSDELVEQSRALNDTIEQALASVPSLHTVAPEVTRRNRAEGKGIFGPVVTVPGFEDRTIAGGVRARVFVPDGGAVDGVYLHLHGGGWTLGAANQQDVGL